MKPNRITETARLQSQLTRGTPNKFLRLARINSFATKRVLDIPADMNVTLKEIFLQGHEDILTSQRGSIMMRTYENDTDN